eukprot:Sspe_Gene.36077::Locus_17458_Transcript_1_1_Confidence_1.000_Length_655::g.36077::m.36077
MKLPLLPPLPEDSALSPAVADPLRIILGVIERDRQGSLHRGCASAALLTPRSPPSYPSPPPTAPSEGRLSPNPPSCLSVTKHVTPPRRPRASSALSPSLWDDSGSPRITSSVPALRKLKNELATPIDVASPRSSRRGKGSPPPPPPSPPRTSTISAEVKAVTEAGQKLVEAHREILGLLQQQQREIPMPQFNMPSARPRTPQ